MIVNFCYREVIQKLNVAGLQTRLIMSATVLLWHCQNLYKLQEFKIGDK
jgi:hypothetical protein